MADVTLKSIRPPEGGSAAIQFQDEESNLGAPDATIVNFTGPGVVASRAGGVVTVTIAGGSGDVTAHEAAVDPHPQYQTGAEVASAISTALADYPDNATVSGAISSASSADRSRSNHTGTQAQSTVDGLEAALAARPETSEVETISNAAAATAMEDHVEAVDPHSQYLTEERADDWLASKTLQALIQFEDESDPLGTPGTVDEVAFVGDGVDVSRVGNRLTVAITGGSANNMSGIYVASEILGGHRIVRSTGAGEVGYASSDGVGHGDDTVGLTTAAVGFGESVQVTHFGYVQFGGWSWTQGQPIFLGTNGLMTQTPPESGFVQVVGHAADTDTVFVSIESPVYY